MRASIFAKTEVAKVADRKEWRMGISAFAGMDMGKGVKGPGGDTK